MSEQYVLAKPVFGYEVDDGDGLLIPMLEDTWYGEDKSLFIPLSVREQQIRDIVRYAILDTHPEELTLADHDEIDNSISKAVAAILGIETNTEEK